MPIKDCKVKNKPGKKYGEAGKCFTGKTAEAKAKRQGKAIAISQRNEKI